VDKPQAARWQPVCPDQRLLVSGLITLDGQRTPVWLQREMSVVSEDGHSVGTVAAVVLCSQAQAITHLLLGCVPPSPQYHLIPLRLIAQVSEGVVRLRATQQEITNFPLHYPNE
jgi:hypothetical protein